MSGLVRVKVEVRFLIQAAEDHKKRLIEEHRKASAKYEAESAECEVKLARAFKKIAEQLVDGKIAWERTYNGHLNVTPPKGFALPVMPTKPVLNTNAVDRDIKLLKAARDDVLSVSTESNWSKYL